MLGGGGGAPSRHTYYACAGWADVLTDLVTDTQICFLSGWISFHNYCFNGEKMYLYINKEQ